MREDLKQVLSRWRFEDARKLLDASDPVELRDLVEALAAMFTNSGWFDGYTGTLVSYALAPFLDGEQPNPVSESPPPMDGKQPSPISSTPRRR